MTERNYFNYPFGPRNHLKIHFSIPYIILSGCDYSECDTGTMLGFQLVCHAVRQLKQFSSNDLEIRVNDEVENQNFPEDFKHRSSPLDYRHDKYQILFDGKVVCTLRESDDCDYMVEYFDIGDDNGIWYDLLLDFASHHCDKFGRSS